MAPSRRDFLRTGAAAAGLGATGAFGALLAACGGSDDGGAATTTTRPPGAGTVPSGALDDLERRLDGQLLRPGDSGYDAASLPANGRYAGTRPAAVAQCAGENDVVTCIRWSNENGVPPVGRGGGHSYAGLSTTEGLLLDISALDSVDVDRDNGTLTCGGSALNGQVLAATTGGPLFLPGGTCRGVGTGGLTLGGGIGYNAHWAGLTCDHMRSSRIVTADGEVLEISPSEHPDLYWACRGGAGGNFGINTSFHFDLVEAPHTDIVFYKFDWYGVEPAGAMFAAFNELLVDAPSELNAVAMAEATPLNGQSPEEAIHSFTRGQFIGTADDLRDLLAPLLEAAGDPAEEQFEPMPFWDAQDIFASEEPGNHSFGDISRYAREPIPTDAVEAWMELLVACPHRTDDANGSLWSLGWVGGDVIGRLDRTETAYVHRDMSTLLRPTVVWPNDAPDSVGEELEGWAQDCIREIEPFTPNESYQNFPNRIIRDWEEQYYAENWDRLVDVKTAYDPDNLFQNPQSIPPRA